ncbi:MAG TPA: NUDIX hydrolase [Gemmatimonadaceae bacterium]|nr:NUDIX hydrolase [Gemmatimonadaceae bacterium]
MKAPRTGARRIYNGRVISLDIEAVRFPDGSTGSLEMVRHPGASAVLPVLSDPIRETDPEILLVRQFRHAAGDFIYEVPAGRLDDGEDPRHCAERELREETGCRAERLDPLISFFTTPGFTDELIHAFVALGVSRGEPSHEDDEFITVESLRLSSALAMVADGRIVDGKTIITLLFAARFGFGR